MNINVKLNLGNRPKVISVKHNLAIDKRKYDNAKYLNWNEDVLQEKRTTELFLYWIDYDTEDVDPQTCIIAHTALEAITILASERWAKNSGSRLIINYIQKFSLKKPKVIFYGNIMPSIHIPELASFNREVVELKNNLKDVKNLKEKTGKQVFLFETKDKMLLVSANNIKEAKKFIRGEGKITNIENKPLREGIVLTYDYEDIYL